MSLKRIACAVGAFFVMGAMQPIDGEDVASPVQVIEYAYSFARPPFIHPKIIQDLSTWLSDRGDQVVAIDLGDSQGSNRYFGDVGVNAADGQCPFVYTEEGGQRFGYQYIGMTKSGVHVLYTSNRGSGSGVFTQLMLLAIAFDYGIDCCDWDAQTAIRADRKRLVIKKLGEIVLGDRWSGNLSVGENELLIGLDQGHFSQFDTTASSHRRADRIVKIDIHPRNPLDFAQHKYPCAGTKP